MSFEQSSTPAFGNKVKCVCDGLGLLLLAVASTTPVGWLIRQLHSPSPVDLPKSASAGEILIAIVLLGVFALVAFGGLAVISSLAIAAIRKAFSQKLMTHELFLRQCQAMFVVLLATAISCSLLPTWPLIIVGASTTLLGFVLFVPRVMLLLLSVALP